MDTVLEALRTIIDKANEEDLKSLHDGLSEYMTKSPKAYRSLLSSSGFAGKALEIIEDSARWWAIEKGV